MEGGIVSKPGTTAGLGGVGPFHFAGAGEGGRSGCKAHENHDDPGWRPLH
ncbi:hypothetical protein PJL18_02893 [Paenarthrobacter nicotinovorans]|nr:hypothetical protein [Paenarthrobacter nicotinovorans]